VGKHFVGRGEAPMGEDEIGDELGREAWRGLVQKPQDELF
jgi:hypothetical protein